MEKRDREREFFFSFQRLFFLDIFIKGNSCSSLR
jgi:hypothetical protein